MKNILIVTVDLSLSNTKHVRFQLHRKGPKYFYFISTDFMKQKLQSEMCSRLH
jgi:hypothetical protein